MWNMILFSFYTSKISSVITFTSQNHRICIIESIMQLLNIILNI